MLSEGAEKVEQCIPSGRGADDEYVPNLWYFELLEFLRDQEIQIPGVSTVDLEEEETQVEVEDLQKLPGSPVAQSCSQKRKKTSVEHLADRNDLLKKAVGQLAKKDNKDEASVYADCWANSFRKLSATQKIYAKKAIEDILVLGQLNALTFHSANSSPPSSTPGSSQVTSMQNQDPVHYFYIQSNHMNRLSLFLDTRHLH
ncbi:hypothetical protein WA026_002738 [Henosepilachna vigintioctopunctata]|uniref:Uncharacterized protein n=1 Tax=Henosepilachna vigintioctopunctata TaxID=420089 RepID=A0AAW1TS66_9CUCU